MFAVGLSLAANVADWLYVGTGAAVLGAVPPLMLAALLLTMHYHAARTEPIEPAQPTTTAVVVPVPATSTNGQPQAAVAAAPPKPDHKARREPDSRARRRGPKPLVSDREVIEAIRQRRQNGPVSRRSLMADFRMGTSRANRLLAAANNGTQLDLTDANS